jgi:hypothetical protein
MSPKLRYRTDAIDRIRKKLWGSLSWHLRPFTQEFSIAVVHGKSLADIGRASQMAKTALTRRDVTDTAAAFVADPFMCRFENRWYMFFEILSKRGWKGEIGLATSDDGLSWSYDKIILTEDFHLSYPYVFEWRGRFYMLPEARQSGIVNLYMSESFPYMWRPVKTLLRDDGIVDASILRFQNSWWLFAASRVRGGPPELRLFMARDLDGSWKEHPKSPLVSRRYDIARPAGRVISVGGRIIRFAQGMQPAYGTDVHAIEITHLDETGYEEVYLGDGPLLGPGHQAWNSGGMHHLDAHLLPDGSWLACVDGWTPANFSLVNILTTMRHPRKN